MAEASWQKPADLYGLIRLQASDQSDAFEPASDMHVVKEASLLVYVGWQSGVWCTTLLDRICQQLSGYLDTQ